MKLFQLIFLKKEHSLKFLFFKRLIISIIFAFKKENLYNIDFKIKSNKVRSSKNIVIFDLK